MHFKVNSQRLLSSFALIVLIVLAIAIYAMGLPLPAGLHPDELGKVNQILSGQYNYLHPLLLLHVGTAANSLLGISDPVQLLDALRFLMLGFSALALLATFLLAGEFLEGWYRHGVVLLLATTPMFAHHAQYLKEDIVLLPFLLGGLWATLVWRRKSLFVWAFIAGIFLGLACASKYIAVLLVLPMTVGFWRDRKSLALMLLTAFFLYILLMMPAVLNSKHALVAIASEIEHGRVGHWLRLHPWVTFMGFHFTHNLVPGGGILMMVGGLVASLWFIFKKGLKHWNWIFLCAFGWFWYVVHELSPSKPYVGGIRYVLPVLPILVLCFAGLIKDLVELNKKWIPDSVGRMVLLGMFIFVAVQNGLKTYTSLVLVGPDPRVAVTLVLSEVPNEVGVVVEGISALQIQKIRPQTEVLQVDTRLTRDSLINRDLFVTSQYYSERFILGLELGNQPKFVIERGGAYLSLLKHPTLYVRGNPMPMPSYRQSDVTLHALSEEGVALLPQMAEKLEKIMPEGSVTLYAGD